MSEETLKCDSTHLHLKFNSDLHKINLCRVKYFWKICSARIISCKFTKMYFYKLFIKDVSKYYYNL